MPQHPEPVWQWSDALNRDVLNAYALDLDVRLGWGTPIRPGDMYLAKRNTGIHLLTCKSVGEGFVVPVENAYSYDFNECVLIIQ